ncbi:hypothetical protein FDP41_013741 [Naegleria fowleri]|uniref:B box-type domain-containing protein n=1 Tax=Naegleria fowleri TaxID=5763 RepID=A0A6A5BTK7_NAEFO|nr:uncharacterized protein FDP41_013741 [Naegleria fowleri]KAF0980527.1 hypothetical protein FDP41_013741 [Naegleria fowleri]CAG4708227.1 unnamed protein product [Naegleria fowleri]
MSTDPADDFQQHLPSHSSSELVVQERLVEEEFEQRQFAFEEEDDFKQTSVNDIHHHHHGSTSQNMMMNHEPNSPLEEVVIDNVQQVDESEEYLDDGRKNRVNINNNPMSCQGGSTPLTPSRTSTTAPSVGVSISTTTTCSTATPKTTTTTSPVVTVPTRTSLDMNQDVSHQTTSAVGSPSNNNKPIHTFKNQDNGILDLTPINLVKSNNNNSNNINTMTPPGTSIASPVMIGSAMAQMEQQSTLSTSPKPIQIQTQVRKDSSPTHHPVQATPGSPQSKRNSFIFTPAKVAPSSSSSATSQTSLLANSIGSAISSIVSITSTLSASLSSASSSSSSHNPSSNSTPSDTQPKSASSSQQSQQQHVPTINDFCEVHKDQRLNTWCHTCGDELVCALCAISRHKGHDYDLVEEVFEKEKQGLKDQIVQMQQNISEKMEKLARDKNLMAQTHEEGVKEINENFDKLEKIIEQKRKEVLEKWRICCEEEISEKILTSGMQQLSQIKFLTDGFLENLSKMEISEFIQCKTRKSLLIQVVIQQFQENLRKIDRSYLSDTLNVGVSFEAMKEITDILNTKFGVIGPKVSGNVSTPNICNHTSSSTSLPSSASSTPTTGSSSSLVQSPNTPVAIEKCRIEGKFVCKFGGKGSEDGQFSSPTDLVIDPNDNIIVCDNENNRVQIFSKEGKFLRKFSVPKPYGVTFDSKEGTILVTSDDHCVYAFDRSGMEVGKFGSKGSDYGMFSYPTGIVVSEPKDQHVPGKIFICDHHNHRIQIFDKYGSFIKSFGTNGTNPEMEGGYFYGPNSIDIDIDGNLVITDRYNSRVQVFTPDGVFVRKFSVKKSEPQNSDGDPTGICCFKRNIGLNYAAICDYNNNRISIWNIRDGTLVKQFGSYGSEDGLFDGPNGVGLTSDGKIVVVDYHNHRVQIFK